MSSKWTEGAAQQGEGGGEERPGCEPSPKTQVGSGCVGGGRSDWSRRGGEGRPRLGPRTSTGRCVGRVLETVIDWPADYLHALPRPLQMSSPRRRVGVLGSPSTRVHPHGAGGEGQRWEGGHLPRNCHACFPLSRFGAGCGLKGKAAHECLNFLPIHFPPEGRSKAPSHVCGAPVLVKCFPLFVRVRWKGRRWARGEEPALGTIAAPWAAGPRTPRLWCGQPVSSQERPGPDSPTITMAPPSRACWGLKVSAPWAADWSARSPDAWHPCPCAPAPCSPGGLERVLP